MANNREHLQQREDKKNNSFLSLPMDEGAGCEGRSNADDAIFHVLPWPSQQEIAIASFERQTKLDGHES